MKGKGWDEVMSAEIIDQANELAERRLEMTIQNMRINHSAVSATHCLDCGEEIPERRRELVAGCQRCADCQEEEELRGSIGGDMASDKPITAQQAADLLIVSARVIYRLIESGELAGRKVGISTERPRLRVLHIWKPRAILSSRTRGKL